MNKLEKKLLSNLKNLNPSAQNSLLDFSDYLLSKENKDNVQLAPEKPQQIPRPPEESVVAAIKRLSQSYHMINKSGVLDQAAQMMTEHMLNGKEAQIVINELEVLFSQKYQLYCDEFVNK
ncbi:MAG: hypothetical protein HQL46_03165 [Gammaproteobacteria bacterium]|nr:hypothetical protein [Gammaproteobacteria bacterium]